MIHQHEGNTALSSQVPNASFFILIDFGAKKRAHKTCALFLFTAHHSAAAQHPVLLYFAQLRLARRRVLLRNLA